MSDVWIHRNLTEDRHGAVRETAPLGDIRCMPLYGTGDQERIFLIFWGIGLAEVSAKRYRHCQTIPSHLCHARPTATHKANGLQRWWFSRRPFSSATVILRLEFGNPTNRFTTGEVDEWLKDVLNLTATSNTLQDFSGSATGFASICASSWPHWSEPYSQVDQEMLCHFDHENRKSLVWMRIWAAAVTRRITELRWQFGDWSISGRCVLPFPVRCALEKLCITSWSADGSCFTVRFRVTSLSQVLRLRCLPDMEGNKFNLTPVDWVAKVRVAAYTNQRNPMNWLSNIDTTPTETMEIGWNWIIWKLLQKNIENWPLDAIRPSLGLLCEKARCHPNNEQFVAHYLPWGLQFSHFSRAGCSCILHTAKTVIPFVSSKSPRKNTPRPCKWKRVPSCSVPFKIMSRPGGPVCHGIVPRPGNSISIADLTQVFQRLGFEPQISKFGLWFCKRLEKNWSNYGRLATFLWPSSHLGNFVLVVDVVVPRYQNLRIMEFAMASAISAHPSAARISECQVQWRELILADPIRFKSWSFCAALTVEVLKVGCSML